jgi:hypothetical protein
MFKLLQTELTQVIHCSIWIIVVINNFMIHRRIHLKRIKISKIFTLSRGEVNKVLNIHIHSVQVRVKGYTDPPKQRQDQVPWRSKHPCWPVASAVRPLSKVKISSQNQYVWIRKTEQSVVKISMSSRANGKIRSQNLSSRGNGIIHIQNQVYTVFNSKELNLLVSIRIEVFEGLCFINSNCW